MNAIKFYLLIMVGSLWASDTANQAKESSLLDGINNIFGEIVAYIVPVLFYPVFSLPHPIAEKGMVELPVIIALLGAGGIFFTLRFKFVNVTLFKHAFDVVRGKFDDPNDHGEISHFKALTSALSATVGLGNIAGVAVAISTGGPGAVFWMWLVAFFGMSMKFASCTLAQLYRKVDKNGTVLGGPMVYLEKGLAEKGLAPLGKVFAVLFAVLTIMGAIGAGNMFQGNQMASLIGEQVYGAGNPIDDSFKWGMGLILAALVGVVILGGIKRIGEVTSKLVPAMVVFYCTVCLVIILGNFDKVPDMFADIFAQAFSPQAAFGGFLGVLIQGMKRAAFSNEAGLGSAAIAHAAAKTKEPVREGTVAMMGPFIDTLVVCTMTALVLLITESHLVKGLSGVQLTSHAFKTLHPSLPFFLTIAVIIFAYSTLISWSYYAEKATEYLFGSDSIKYFRIAYSIIVVLGPVLSISHVLDFADLMLLSMAFPNIIGMVILSGKVNSLLEDYTKRLKSGAIQPYK